ncbi:hypothetical protein A0J61_10606 [Choanephora cucurbitarum]|uniref:Uncharacterized protein n=1 Tax=Choanephora cucurbitarum TaxID=101091 RepID=A0A1C7N1V3_9FUNG|nr:hypothetical protein A0J61_10606 [Choanephora cucurbitarum]
MTINKKSTATKLDITPNTPNFLREASTPLLPMMASSDTAFDQLSVADLCQQMQEMNIRVSKLEEMEMRMNEMQQEIDELRRNCTCESDRSSRRSKTTVRSQ